MPQISPKSAQANMLKASQEIPRILRNPKFSYSVYWCWHTCSYREPHESGTPDSILFKDYFNFNLLTMSYFPSASGLPTKHL
jgi:hypothetical protein